MTHLPTTKTRMNAEQYKKLPESNLHVELIDGELIVYQGKDGMSPAPKDIHQQMVLACVSFLLTYFPHAELRVAPTDVYLESGEVVQPDVFWVNPKSHQCILHNDGYLHGAPDFVIEIVSPATAKHDRGTKFNLYEKYGVREYWLVDPDGRFVEVYRREKDTFIRQGLFDEEQSFVSSILGGKTVQACELLR